MHTISGTAEDFAGTGSAPASGMTCDDKLLLILAQPMLTRVAYRKALKLKALVQACYEGRELLAGELAHVLGCSMSALRRYIGELEAVQVIKIVRYTGRVGVNPKLPVYGLGKNQQNVQAIISWKLTDPFSPGLRGPQTTKQRKKSTLTAGTPENKVIHRQRKALTEVDGGTVHLCEDGPNSRFRANIGKYGRDPLVAAIFGKV